MFIERMLLVSKNMYEIRYRSTSPKSYAIGLCGFVQTDKLDLLLASVAYFNNSSDAIKKGIELVVFPCDVKHSLSECDPCNMDAKKHFEYRSGYYKGKSFLTFLYMMQRR